MGNKVLLKMLLNVATRRNTKFYMLKCLLQLKTSIQETVELLDNAPPCLNSEEWSAIKEFCNIL
jgi:hypothetical protein